MSFCDKEKKALFLDAVESHDLQTLLKHIMSLLQRHAVEPKYALIGSKVILYGANARRLATKLNALQTWFKHRNFLALMDLKGGASAELHLVVNDLFSVWRDLRNELTLLNASNGLPDKHPAIAFINEANALSKNLRNLEINFRVYHQARTSSCSPASKDDLLAFLDAMVDDSRSNKLIEIAQFCLVPRFSYPGVQAVTDARKKLHAELAPHLGDVAAREMETSESEADEDGGFKFVGPNLEDNPNMARAVVESVDNNYDVRFSCRLPRRGFHAFAHFSPATFPLPLFRLQLFDPLRATLADITNRGFDMLVLRLRSLMRVSGRILNAAVASEELELDLAPLKDANDILTSLLDFSPGQGFDVIRVTEKAPFLTFSTSKQFVNLCKGLRDAKRAAAASGSAASFSRSAAGGGAAAAAVPADVNAELQRLFLAWSEGKLELEVEEREAAEEDAGSDAGVPLLRALWPQYTPTVRMMHQKIFGTRSDDACPPIKSPFLNDPFYVLRGLRTALEAIDQSSDEGGVEDMSMKQRAHELLGVLNRLVIMRDMLAHQTNLTHRTNLKPMAVKLALKDMHTLQESMQHFFYPAAIRGFADAAGSAVAEVLAELKGASAMWEHFYGIFTTGIADPAEPGVSKTAFDRYSGQLKTEADKWLKKKGRFYGTERKAACAPGATAAGGCEGRGENPPISARALATATELRDNLDRLEETELRLLQEVFAIHNSAPLPVAPVLPPPGPKNKGGKVTSSGGGAVRFLDEDDE